MTTEDLSSATRHAARYHRHWAMGERLSRTDITCDSEQHLNTDVEFSNALIESTLQAELDRAKQLLSDAREPFEKLVNALLEKHIQQVEVRVEALLQLKRHLLALREKCSGARAAASCGILQGLSGCACHAARVDGAQACKV